MHTLIEQCIERDGNLELGITREGQVGRSWPLPIIVGADEYVGKVTETAESIKTNQAMRCGFGVGLISAPFGTSFAVGTMCKARSEDVDN